MAKLYTGMDIGSSDIKLSLCQAGKVKRAASIRLPENLVRDGEILSPEVMAGAIRRAARRANIRAKDCAIALPSSLSLFRRLTVPAMTAEQLELNLPYEFRDYITEDKDNYFYDYAVVGKKLSESGEVESYDLMAAAATKETIHTYQVMLRRAGFKLRIAVPEEFAYANILRRYIASHPDAVDREFCLIDLGHSASRVHIFTGARYETTRVIEHGGASVDMAIADSKNVDIHVADGYKLANHENVLSAEICQSVYQEIAVDIMRAINFYGFNNPQSSLNEIYLSGGAAAIPQLVSIVAQTLEGRSVRPLSELMPPCRSVSAAEYLRCPVAVGAALE